MTTRWEYMNAWLPDSKLVVSINRKAASTSLRTAFLIAIGVIDKDAENPKIKHVQGPLNYCDPAKVKFMVDVHHAEVVAFVRHPMARLSSAYRSRGMPDIARTMGLTRDCTFQQFAAAACNTSDDEADKHIRSQRASVPVVHHYFRIEDMDWADVRRFFQKRKCYLPDLRRLNRSAIENVSWRGGLADMVRDRYADDFEEFGYQ